MAKVVKLKDRNSNSILPITRSTVVEMNEGISVEEKFRNIEKSQKLSFYTTGICSVNIYTKDDTLEGDYSEQTPIKTIEYSPNTLVSLNIGDTEHFEISNPNDCINIIYNWPGVCETFYDWFMGVSMFCNMVFNFNKMDHTPWEHSYINGSQYKFGVVGAQYRNCIFWWDVACTNINKHCYVLHKTQECPLFYSTVPANTYKAVLEAYNITVNPNWTNDDFLNSFSQASGINAFAYTQIKSVPFAAAADAGVVTNIITLPANCQGLFYRSLAHDTAILDCTNVTTFGYNQSSWRIAFYNCYELRHLMLKNLKVSVDLSWSPISNYALDYIISEAANTGAIDIKLSPYTWYNLTDAIKTAATTKNINLVLGSVENNANLKIWNDAPEFLKKSELAVEINYADLVTLRNNSGLVPGTEYRITDYACTTTQANTQSAGHQFDIVVTATDVNTLNENAKAVKHDGDTYFANSDLDAWEIKYSLDNDKNSFAWADETNGKGVIFYMKDEWNNECPYDFKNIQFKRWAVTDVQNSNLDSTALDALKGVFVYDNDNSKFITRYAYQNSNCVHGTTTLVVDSNNSGWYYTFSTFKYENEIYAINEIEDASIKGNNFYNDEGGKGCLGNSIKPYYNNTASNDGDDVIDGTQYLNNIVFNGFYETDEQPYIYHCFANSIGYNSYNITFGNNCYSNFLGDECNSIIFGHDCCRNTFGIVCFSNTFGIGCDSNTFGNGYDSNTFGDSCNYNTFGSNCSNNTFGIACNSNTFGDECYHNAFGNICNFNTFGNGCHYVMFANTTTGTSNDYYRYITVEDNVEFVLLRYTGTLNVSNRLQNIKICTGVKGILNSYKQITHPTVNDTFQTIYRNDEEGTTEGGIVALKSDLLNINTKNVVAATNSFTTSTTTPLPNGNVYINHVSNDNVKSSLKIYGSYGVNVIADSSANISVEHATKGLLHNTFGYHAIKTDDYGHTIVGNPLSYQYINQITNFNYIVIKDSGITDFDSSILED